jgi:hypothetical protein
MINYQLSKPCHFDAAPCCFSCKKTAAFPFILQYLGLGAAYGLYTTAAAISLFFVFFFIKETKGIELEDM